MVCQAVGQPRSVVAIQHCGALTVEVRIGFVGIEFVEYRWQRSSPKMLGRNGIASIQVDEISVSSVNSAIWLAASRLSAQ